MFAKRLRQLRREADLTQAQLAEALGATRGMIASYETGGKQPPLDILMKIADYFDCSIDYLVGKTDEKKAGAVVVKGDDLPKILRDAGFIQALVSREALAELSDEELRGIALRALQAMEDRKEGKDHDPES
jgi:transcriptional regulator with XRE-family HTH domain